MYLFLFLSLHESCSNHRCYCGSHRAPSTSNSCHDTQPLPLPLPTCRQPPFQPFFSSFLHPILFSSSSSSSSSSWMEACIPLTSAEENYLFEVDDGNGETGYPHASNAIVLRPFEAILAHKGVNRSSFARFFLGIRHSSRSWKCFARAKIQG